MITNPLVEQGRQQGVEQGRQQGIQRSILRILGHRLAEFPSELHSQIMALNDTEKLECLLDAVLDVDSPEYLTQNRLFEI